MKNFSYLRTLTFVDFVDLHFAKCLKHKKKKINTNNHPKAHCTAVKSMEMSII